MEKETANDCSQEMMSGSLFCKLVFRWIHWSLRQSPESWAHRSRPVAYFRPRTSRAHIPSHSMGGFFICKWPRRVFVWVLSGGPWMAHTWGIWHRLQLMHVAAVSACVFVSVVIRSCCYCACCRDVPFWTITYSHNPSSHKHPPIPLWVNALPPMVRSFLVILAFQWIKISIGNDVIL